MGGRSLVSQVLWCASFAVCTATAMAGTACDPTSPAAPDAATEWWVDLSLAPSARVAANNRAAQLRRIKQQQTQLAADLGPLGLSVSASVVHVRNAVVVQMTAEQASVVRRSKGVVAVRPALDCHRVGLADVFVQPASWRGAGSGRAA
jgi:hypothetical protein